jgi:hypothetical protein
MKLTRILQDSALGLSLVAVITACSPDAIQLAGSSSNTGEKNAKIAKRGSISTDAVRPGEGNPELDSTTELLGSDNEANSQSIESGGSSNVQLPENVSGAFLVGCSSIVPADGSVPMVTCGVESGDGEASILSVSSIRVKASDPEGDDDESSSWISVDMSEMNFTESSVSFPMAIELLEETKIEVSAEVRILNPSGKQMIKHMVIKRKSKKSNGNPSDRSNSGRYKKADLGNVAQGEIG